MSKDDNGVQEECLMYIYHDSRQTTNAKLNAIDLVPRRIYLRCLAKFTC